MAKQGMILYDGMKAVPAWDFDNLEGWTPLGGQEDLQGIDVFFTRVPWLYRGVVDRANCMSKMPFAIRRGDTDFLTSQDYEPKAPVDFLPNPTRLFRQLEQSLVMLGRAYAFLETNPAGWVKSVKYCNPNSIEEVYEKTTGALLGYKRKIGALGQSIEVKPANIVAIYDPDYLTETGRPQASAAYAALTASGVLYNADRFIADYFRRGAIKATIITTESGRDEAERLQNWWQDVVAGIKNAWTALVLKAKEVKATVIGGGLEDLQNNELTTERRQDIATALGIPESHMWSAAANYATRIEDEKAYYENTVIPECDLIAEAFNSQLFTKEHKLDGFRLVFQTQSLDIFQEDTAAQSNAAKTFNEFVTSCPSFDMFLATAALIGFEITDEMKKAAKAYFADKEKKAEEMARQLQEKPAPPEPGQDEEAQGEEPAPPPPNEQEVRGVLNAWKRKAELWLKKNGSAACPFETTIIPLDRQGAIRAALALAKTNEEIKAAVDTLPDKIDQLKRANDLLERVLAV